jgi:hypothetical protein
MQVLETELYEESDWLWHYDHDCLSVASEVRLGHGLPTGRLWAYVCSTSKNFSELLALRLRAMHQDEKR